jgi:hypothetical protein
MIFIYALVDPFTFKVRYVGKTICPEKRYTRHLRSGNPDKMAWIEGLRKRGFKPVFHILDVLKDDANWQERERLWITYFRESDCCLLNADNGGNGGRVITERTRQRMRVTHLGFRHSESTKEKLRLIVTGRKQRPETIEKLRNRPHTWGNKISASKMGHEVTEDMKAKMRERRIAYFDRKGRARDKARDYLLKHPEHAVLSCRALGRMLGLNHHPVSLAKRKLGYEV